MRIKVSNPESFIKRMFYLLWKAVPGTSGMGFLQDNPSATEDDVFENVRTSGDYVVNRNQDGRFYADYVFGRMIKWGCVLDNDIIEIPHREFRSDYQGFSGTFKNNKDIVEATANSLGVEYAEVEPCQTGQ